MTRTAREISEYGFYHVVQKGCGGQLIFEDEDDRFYLIRLIASKCQKFKVDVIAWCLMDNHIHLLLDDEHAHLSDCMHSIRRRMPCISILRQAERATLPGSI